MENSYRNKLKMNVLRIALFSILLSVVSCNTKEKQIEVVKTEDSTAQASKFKYWNWITVGHKKSDSAYTAHFNKLKSNGIDAVLMNTGADPKLLKRLTPLAKDAGLEVHAWMFTTNRPGDSIADMREGKDKKI